MDTPLTVGDRVGVDVGPHWAEPATITAIAGAMATVELDETIELPGELGGGWMRIVDRELETLWRYST